MAELQEPFWDRTRKLIREYWPLGDPVPLKDVIGATLPKSDIAKVKKKIDACLEGTGGEVSARARAAELGEAYLVLNGHGRRRFLELLATDYDVDDEAVSAAAAAWQEAADPAARRSLADTLQNLLEPPRAKILRQFNGLRGGVKFLVDLRAELMRWAKDNEALRELDQDLHRLLASWFDIGFLDLQQITWQTSAALLEKLIQYEAVHAIRSWKDLKNRLEEDRRCYAYFHPSMPDEPLIFVEVALVNGIAASVQELLDEKAPLIDPVKADTAIFYSISNCQAGLAGVSFGNFLIKRVVADLAAKLPNLRTFATLSPIPGFVSWLYRQEDSLKELKPPETKTVKVVAEVIAQLAECDSIPDLIASADRTGDTDETVRQLQQSLLQLCGHYLLNARRGRQAEDRVAHFHLTNGASIRQINWGANLSAKGIEESFGMMVNYLYDLPSIERHHEAYSGSGEINAAAAVRRLAR